LIPGDDGEFVRTLQDLGLEKNEMVLNFIKRKMVRGFQRKEPDAIAWIHNYYYAFVFKVVEKMIVYTPDMEKLVDVVFIKLPDAASRLDSLEKIRDFLYLTARTTCLDYMKREEWRGSERADHFYHNLNPYDREQVGIQTHFDYLMNEAASRLSYKKQQVLRLFYCEAADDEEASRELQLSERTAANRRKSALKKLKLYTSHSNDYQFH
jgi:RNA polymerase sigma factor (sigma-70 family)